MAVDVNDNGQFNFSPNTITAEDYAAIQQEQQDLQQKLLHAPNEFMYQHYSRLLKAMDVTQAKAAVAKVKLEQRDRRALRKQKRDELKNKK